MDLDQLLSWLLLLFVIGLITLYYTFKNRNLPPGPRGLPLLGFAPFFGHKPPHTFLALKKTYGKIFSMYMGPQLTIVLNDYEAIKEAYVCQAEVFAATADAFIFRYLSVGNDGKMHGILLAEGEPWRIQKKFMTQTFRDLGVGKAKLEDRILEEAEILCDTFAKQTGKAIGPAVALGRSTANVICWLCFGRRFDPADVKFGKVFDDLLMIADDLAQSGPLQAFPILRLVPGPLKTIWKRFERVTITNRSFNNEMITEHEATYIEGETRDYIDAFIHQQRQLRFSNGKLENSCFEHDDLLTSLGVFFGTATETTSVTLQWVLLFLITFPEVQKKAQKAIDEHVGPGRSVTMDDRSDLSYVEAVCREVQRMANVTPFGVLRSNIVETTLFGYRIPKRSFIMPNFLAVHMDPTLWENPTEFKPERFLDASGQVFEPPFYMPFSIGKRNCVGESLARMEIFLFTANLLQKFEFSVPKDYPAPPITEYNSGISSRPLPYKVIVELRSK